MTAAYATYDSPYGQGYLLVQDGRVRLLVLPGQREEYFWRQVRARLGLGREDVRPAGICPEARDVEEFLVGKKRRLDFIVDPPGTPFQQAVWQQLRKIPYGKTATYGEIAKAAGRPGAARAVGAACGANPIALAIPCHRVIGASGQLTGFGGGLPLKARLLELERRS